MKLTACFFSPAAWLWFPLGLFSIFSAHAQQPVFFSNSKGLQHGIAVKVSFELAENKKPTFRLGLSGGIAQFVLGEAVYPAVHAELQLYNNGFGSPKNSGRRPAISMDMVLSGTVHMGGGNRFKQFADRRPGRYNYPLYYFNNFTKAPLQNPFQSSFGVGSNLVFNPGHKHPFQQVGFVNLKLGGFQLSYFNDGTPLHWVGLGDGRDRYYTGGGIVSYSLKAQTAQGKLMPLDLFEFTYHKYTGFVPDAFEIANMLDLSFLNYAEEGENHYNKSMWTFAAGSSTRHYQASVSAFNYTTWDAQHIIHRLIFNAYHRVPHSRYFTPRLSGYLSTTKIGLQ